MKSGRESTVLRLAAALVVVLVVAGVVLVRSLQSGPTDATLPQVTAVDDQSSAPTSLQTMQEMFGPWVLAQDRDAQPGQLLLLRENGSTELSSWFLRPDDSWPPSELIQLVGVEQQAGIFRVRFDNDRSYTIAVNEPFVLDRLPTQVFAFRQLLDGGYGIVSISVFRAFELGERSM